MKLLKLLLAASIFMLSTDQACASLSALKKSAVAVSVAGMTGYAHYIHSQNETIIPTMDESLEDENAEFLYNYRNDDYRVKYLENAFKDYQLYDDVSSFKIARLFRHSDKIDLDKIINASKMHANEKKSKVISMNEINKAYIDSSMREHLQETLNSEQLIVSGDASQVHRAKLISFHEGAHALVEALLPVSSLVYSATRMQSSDYAGHIESSDLHLSDVDDISHGNNIFQTIPFHRLELDAKNHIMILLAGRLGAIICDEQLYENEDKSDFKFYRSLDNKNCVPGYVIGQRYHNADLGRAYKVAEDFVKWKKFDRGDLKYNDDIELDYRPAGCYKKDGKCQSFKARELYINYDNGRREDVEFGLEVDAFMQECYQELYKIMSRSENKEKLHIMACAIIEKGFIFTDEIYSIAGVAIPKHDFELTVTENALRNIVNSLFWMSKKINFYEKNHPQI